MTREHRYSITKTAGDWATNFVDVTMHHNTMFNERWRKDSKQPGLDPPSLRSDHYSPEWRSIRNTGVVRQNSDMDISYTYTARFDCDACPEMQRSIDPARDEATTEVAVGNDQDVARREFSLDVLLVISSDLQLALEAGQGMRWQSRLGNDRVHPMVHLVNTLATGTAKQSMVVHQKRRDP